MKTISLCMIVKDEQAVIERCLRAAVVFADEIIVVDTGSTDATKVIAKRYTDKVYDYIWQDDFAAARNYAYSFATCDYILWLDADDVLEGDSINAICDLKYSLTDEVDVVTFVYSDDINEQLIQGNDRILRDRLIKRLLSAQWCYPIHEAIPLLLDYRISHADQITVLHRKEVINDSQRNMRIFKGMEKKHIPLNAFNRYFYCRELYFMQCYAECVQEYMSLKLTEEPRWILDALPYAIWSLHMLCNDECALNELLSILKVAPPNEFVCCELGNCFLKKTQYEQAEFWYRKSLAIQVDLRDLHPHFLAYEKFLPCLKLGVLYAKQGDFKRAIEYNDCAMQVFPNNIISKCNDMFYRNQLCIAKPTQQNL